MSCSDWINLLVAIGTISLAIAAFLNIKRFREEKHRTDIESRRTLLKANLVSCRKWAQSYLELFGKKIDIRTNEELIDVRFNLAKLSDMNSSIAFIQSKTPDSILEKHLKDALKKFDFFGISLSRVNVVGDFVNYKGEIELIQKDCIRSMRKVLNRVNEIETILAL